MALRQSAARALPGSRRLRLCHGEGLQRTFPALPGSGFDGVSDVELTAEWLMSKSRKDRVDVSPASLLSVGSLSNMAKGADTLIDALAILKRRGRRMRRISLAAANIGTNSSTAPLQLSVGGGKIYPLITGPT